MPRKIRELKADLRRAGFRVRPGKGSHAVWWHPLVTDTVSMSGGDGDDAERYQEKAVRFLLNQLREAERKNS